jgi:hypothetical protein
MTLFMVSWSGCDPKTGGPDDGDSDTEVPTEPEPTSNQAQLNFIWMSTTDPALNTMVGAILEIYDQDGNQMSMGVDVRSNTDVVFDWNPGVLFNIGKTYVFKLKDPAGNLVDTGTFDPSLAIDQDEFALVTSKCIFFLQLSWQIA